MGGEEQLKSNLIDMALHRGTSHRRAVLVSHIIINMMCVIFVMTCHHRCHCHAFSSHIYTSTGLLNGDRMILAYSPRPLQTNKNDVPSARQLELSGRATDKVEIRSRQNIFVIKTHEDNVKFIEEDHCLFLSSVSRIWFVFH